MDFLIIFLALVALITVAYRGYSIIIFAPIVALAAVMFFDPLAMLPAYTNLFMQKTSEFVRNFFPLFMLGAIFGKVIEMSGFAKSITLAIFKAVGEKNAILTIVLVAAILSYGGVSAHVIVFTVYPFAAEMFKMAVIPKRLIPGVIWLGGVTFTMDALPGSPQIQNIIPTSFFGTDAFAAPILGIIGSVFILVLGMMYFIHLQKKAAANGDTYASGVELIQEPAPLDPNMKLPPWQLAMIPLILVGVVNFLMTRYGIPNMFGEIYTLDFPGIKPIEIKVATMRGLWAVEIAMISAILCTILLALKSVVKGFTEGMKPAMSAALLAIMNTASEYGYGSIIAALPGFLFLVSALKGLSSDPLVTEAITVNVLAGIVGSASGGISIAMGAMADMFKEMAAAANIPLEVVHRIASMSSGGMDSLPHNGAVITAMFVTGLTHRQAYMPILAITAIKTAAIPVVIIFYHLTGLY
ncbi:MAG: GntP family permease [Desulfovibrionaceae bacterium]|nr:GntP family permease [Desulfovibrionaceae bacterium]